MRDWTLLNGTKRQILRDVESAWCAMLDDIALKESHYQAFLEAHSGLFFSRPGSHLVIAKPEMGGDYIPDLVIVSDNESYGFKYEFIELESAHDQVFNGKGRQAIALTDALQQVEDWKRFFAKHPDLGSDLFPSKAYKIWGDPQVEYSIVIGRRKEMDANNEVRLQKSAQYQCKIRSFDYLVSRIQKQLFANELYAECDQSLTAEEKNLIVSPMFRAMSSAQWKDFRSPKTFYNSHSLGYNEKSILKLRPMNDELLAKFDNS